MEIRKIKRNEIPDACRLSHMVYEMAIRRNRPADEQRKISVHAVTAGN